MSSGIASSPNIGATHPGSFVPSLTDTDTVDLLRIEKALIDAAMSGKRRQDALAATLRLVAKVTNAITIVYSVQQENGDFVPIGQVRPRCSPDEFRSILGTVQTSAAAACKLGIAEINRVSSPSRLSAITVPVMVDGKHTEALTAILLLGTEPVEPFLVILQLVAASISLWSIRPSFVAAARDSASAHNLLGLVERVITSDDRETAAQVAADEVRAQGDFAKVAIGLCKRHGKRCKVVAVSDSPANDQRSKIVEAVEPLMDEAILRRKTVVWPSPNGADAAGTVAQKRILEVCDATFVISGPLSNRHGESLGAWVIVGNKPAASAPEHLQQVLTLEKGVGMGLGMLPRTQRRRTPALLGPVAGSWSGWSGIVKIACVLAVVAVLAIPMPYRVSCDCVLQPVKRRFVAAPFEARLKEVLVEPGDLVTRGQVLARLDGREIRWELAGLRADASRAKKVRDTSLASQDVAASQIAALEMERLELKTRLMEDRMEHLDIKAPVDGLVIAGDQKKTEGAPLPTGQVLFEIAPLDKMVAEVEIPGSEISQVEVGQEVAIRLDAHASIALRGALTKIYPRAETRQGRSVFVGDVLLDNPGQLLRPGMIGEAKVVTATHPLGWNLFHSAFERALCWLGK